MSRTRNIFINLIFGFQVLLTFLLWVGDKIKLPVWLQVIGRLHPLMLHLPIGLAVFFFILLLLPRRNEVENETLNKITFIVLFLSSFTASLTALCGFLLSLQGDYGADSLMQHKVSSTILSWLCYLMLISYDKLRERKGVFIGMTSLMVVMLLFSGHTGATLTHGENFVFEPLTKDARLFLTTENSSVYQLAVQPVLEKKCYSCHNESKAKGKLVMTSVEQFMKGGKHGKEWVEGKPEESNLIKMIHLPLTHDQHMPPDGKAQLTEKEIHLLETWIHDGVNFEKKLADLKPSDSLRIIASAMLKKNEKVEEKKYSFKPASEETIGKLNSPFCSLSFLYENSPALRADFFVQQAFDVKTLENLKEVEDQLVELNLSHMPVTDKELLIISKFKNLEKLNLNFTKITDLKSLKLLIHLTSLSLSGTPVSAQSLKEILPLPELKELFIWNTSISDNDQQAIHKQYPNLNIVWSLFQDDQPIKLSKPGLANDGGVLKKNERIVLKHVMPGVTIRYTLDGVNPDSVTGQIYKAPIAIESTTMLKACAYKDSWLQSDRYETICFIEGYKPRNVELLSKPDPQYPGEGAQSLMDGRKGYADLLKEPSWLGFKENPFVAGFDFGDEVSPVKEITISYARNTGSYIFPPTEVEVWAGNNQRTVNLIKSVKVPQPKNNEPAKVDALIIPLTAAKYVYYKIMAKPVGKLPVWHSGKGQKGWFFVDEVFFN